MSKRSFKARYRTILESGLAASVRTTVLAATQRKRASASTASQTPPDTPYSLERVSLKGTTQKRCVRVLNTLHPLHLREWQGRGLRLT